MRIYHIFGKIFIILFICNLNLYPIWAIMSQKAIKSRLGDRSQPCKCYVEWCINMFKIYSTYKFHLLWKYLKYWPMWTLYSLMCWLSLCFKRNRGIRFFKEWRNMLHWFKAKDKHNLKIILSLWSLNVSLAVAYENK